MQEQMRKRIQRKAEESRTIITETRSDGFINKLNIAEKESMNLKKCQKLKPMQRK